MILNILLSPIRLAFGLLKPFSDALDLAFRPVINRILKKTSLNDQVGYFDNYFSDNSDPLLRGDLFTAAKRDWPEEKYPTFYRWIPPDLRKPIVIDGRIRGSAVLPISVFPPAGITNELVNQAKNAAAKVGLKWGIIGLITCAAIAMTLIYPFAGEFQLPAWQPALGIDYWSSSSLELEKTAGTLWLQLTFLAQVIASSSVSVLLILITSIATSLTLAAIVFWGNWRSLIFAAANENAEAIRQESKEATVRWKYRYEARELEETAYLKQLQEVDRLNSPTLTLGQATGVFNFRGVLASPRQNTKLKIALEDLFQNTLVLGGTGSGKTFALLTPVAAQLIKLQSEQDVSIYATDSKGVLWQDIKAIADKLGRPTQIIGIGKAELGVDLLDGLEPGFAADVIKSVMRQMGGTAGDSFWPDLAHNCCVHVLKVLQAWERTENGIKYAENTGERPYSLVRLYEVAMQAKDSKADSVVAKMESDILDCVENDPTRIADLANVGLFASLEYLRETWPAMAKDTRSGIEANITNALGLFVSNVELRRKFASGEHADITIDEMWGRKITLVNLPESLGNAGRIVNVMLKSLLFNKAKLRQAAVPDIKNKQQLAFLADEYQALITSDLASGFTDSSFPNVARSTGLFYFVATQGIRALEQAVGEISAANFINNMRNKIFLQIEEPATMDLSKKLAGKTLRFYSYDNDDFESYEAMRREVGYEPSLLGEATLSTSLQNEAGLIPGIWGSGIKFDFGGSRKKFEAKTESIRRAVSKAQSGIGAGVNEHHRAEDKNADYMKSGNEFHDVLTDSDLMQMGRTHAYVCISRAGHLRQDIVSLQGVQALMPELID